MNFREIFNFLPKKRNNIPTLPWWQRKSNKIDNKWHNIGDLLRLFNGEWGLQKLTKGDGVILSIKMRGGNQKGGIL